MRYKQHFLFIRERPDRAIITDEWISGTVEAPVRTEIQSDGRIRKWGFIEEVGKYLRLVLLVDGKNVHNAFFDTGFKK